MYLSQNSTSFTVILAVGHDIQTVVSSVSAGWSKGCVGSVLQKA